MSKSILYIGNDHLSKKLNYKIAMEILYENLTSEGYQVLKYSDKINKPLRLIHMIYGILLNFRKVDYVIIDTYSTSNFYYALLCSQLSRVLKLKYIPILHGGNLPARVKKNPFLSKLIFKNSLINVAPSNYLYSYFKNLGYTCVLIPNTIPIVDYEFKERKIVKPNLLWVRAYAKIYNPSMALEVLRLLLEKYPNAKLCMIGPDRDGILESIKKNAIEKGLEKSIEFVGALTKQQWHVRSKEFDIFINTTNFDNTPVSVIEAMALGFPVVSTDVGGLPYLIEDKKNGLLVKPNDAFSMVKAVEELILKKHPNISMNARDYAKSFDWSNIRTKWLSIFSN